VVVLGLPDTDAPMDESGKEVDARYLPLALIKDDEGLEADQAKLVIQRLVAVLLESDSHIHDGVPANPAIYLLPLFRIPSAERQRLRFPA
jgi:hypothetical protein